MCADSLRCRPPATRGLRGITQERVSVAGRAGVANGREKGAVVAASALKIGVSEMASTEYEHSTGSRLTDGQRKSSRLVHKLFVAVSLRLMRRASEAKTGV